MNTANLPNELDILFENEKINTVKYILLEKNENKKYSVEINKTEDSILIEANQIQNPEIIYKISLNLDDFYQLSKGFKMFDNLEEIYDTLHNIFISNKASIIKKEYNFMIIVFTIYLILGKKQEINIKLNNCSLSKDIDNAHIIKINKLENEIKKLINDNNTLFNKMKDLEDITKAQNDEITNLKNIIISKKTKIKNTGSIIDKNKANKIIKGFIVWIDSKVNNEENKKYKKMIEENELIEQFNLEIFCFNNLEEAINFILNFIDFKPLFIIISGSLYPYYYHIIKENINIIRCLPISIIFTSNKGKEILLKRRNQFNLTEEILDSINNPFYNLGGICSNIDSCINFIFNYIMNNQNNYKPKEYNKNQNRSYDGCITFELINSKNQLYLPFKYNELINEEKISNNEIQIFINYLLMNHQENKIVNLILPLLYNKEIPHEIIAKFILRAYTMQTSFCYEMNYLLMKSKGKPYQPFIKIAYEGLLNNSLYISFDEYLYRGSQMSKLEINKIMKEFEMWKKKPKNNLPSFILYSRSFLSFSKEEKEAKKFIKKTDDNNYSIFFILKNYYNQINNYSSNADIESLSIFGNEKEVLFFPFSCFCLENIYKDNYQGIDCIIINLEYLGKYSHILRDIHNDENFKNNYINTFNNQNFVKELIKSEVFSKAIQEEEDNEDKNKNKTKYVFKKIKKKIKQELNIEINEETNDKNILQENNNIIINAKEKIFLEEKNDNVINFEEIASKLDKIKLPKVKSFYFYLTSFKPEKTENIWSGEFDDENQKTGKGKEYDFDDNIVFEGEYYNNEKIRGIEYYIIGTKKFEGDYNNNKRWNGIFYDINNKYKYELNSGKGFIKEYYENGCLAFEGEIRQGEKNGKGKLYDECGHLVFEGELENGIKKGKGILYDYRGNIIFEGEINNNEKISGKEFKYNEKCELINHKNDNEQKMYNFISKKDYMNFSNIDNCVWIMKKENKKELYINTLFEGEYKEGKKYKGKEYDNNGKLIFEGEFRNDKRWNGIILEGEYKDGIEYKGKENYTTKMIIEEGTQEDDIYLVF